MLVVLCTLNSITEHYYKVYYTASFAKIFLK